MMMIIYRLLYDRICEDLSTQLAEYNLINNSTQVKGDIIDR